MTIEERYADIIAQYPPKITKMQFCEITGMCKSTAFKLLKKKQIGYRKKRVRLLHFYEISLDDALREKYNKDIIGLLLTEYNALARSFYEQLLSDLPDALFTGDLKSITGYTNKTVQSWLLQGEINSQIIWRKYVVTKDDLIDFLVSERYLTILMKSNKHLAEIEHLKKLTLGEGDTQCFLEALSS